ncbi:MAG: RNA polymerase sigma factor [Bacteroidota bacterium]
MNQRTIHIHESLVEGCRKNNRRSQLELYKMYYKAMYNTALRIIQDSAEAEDVMQEAFLTAFQKIEDYKGEATIGAWLKRIVVNRALDQLKKRKETVPVEEANLEMPDDDSTENYLEILSYKVEEIRKGIEKLNEDDRVIISLFLLEGYDHEEISQVLGISNNTSRTRYSRAKQRLRSLLGQEKIDQLVN